MNGREVYLVIACAAVVVGTVMLRLFDLITWAGVSSVIAVALGVLALSVLAYCAYVITSLEFGYKTENETRRRVRNLPSHSPHPLQTLLHLRVSRHR